MSVIQQLSRVVAWALLVTIVVLSFVPPGLRPVTPAPHYAEHLGIFLATGVAFGFGYAWSPVLQAIALVAFSAAIELIQLGIVGRHARLSDFVVNAVSISVGVGIGWTFSMLWRRYRPGDGA
jgi:VanZ family protein